MMRNVFSIILENLVYYTKKGKDLLVGLFYQIVGLIAYLLIVGYLSVKNAARTVDEDRKNRNSKRDS